MLLRLKLEIEADYHITVNSLKTDVDRGTPEDILFLNNFLGKTGILINHSFWGYWNTIDFYLFAYEQ
jgi:hypothetical protein